MFCAKLPATSSTTVMRTTAEEAIMDASTGGPQSPTTTAHRIGGTSVVAPRSVEAK
jgi:hypothetical protein